MYYFCTLQTSQEALQMWLSTWSFIDLKLKEWNFIYIYKEPLKHNIGDTFVQKDGYGP